jgi:glutaredoxin-related protein
MNEQEKALEQAALEFARANKKKIAREITDRKRYLSESNPVSVFMAGSPGAGKTEFSKRYLSLLQENSGYEILRIDPDDYRSRIPGYTGNNSWLVQSAATIITEKVFDLALEQKQSFLLDGTFADWGRLRIRKIKHAKA